MMIQKQISLEVGYLLLVTDVINKVLWVSTISGGSYRIVEREATAAYKSSIISTDVGAEELTSMCGLTDSVIINQILLKV